MDFLATTQVCCCNMNCVKTSQVHNITDLEYLSWQKQSPGLRGSQFHSLLKKKQNASLNKDCTFNTLHELEVELVRFVSTVRSLKGAMATGNVSNLKLRRSGTPTDPHRVTIYDIWGEESSSWMDLCVKVGEKKVECWQTVCKLIKVFWRKELPHLRSCFFFH